MKYMEIKEHKLEEKYFTYYNKEDFRKIFNLWKTFAKTDFPAIDEDGQLVRLHIYADPSENIYELYRTDYFFITPSKEVKKGLTADELHEYLEHLFFNPKYPEECKKAFFGEFLQLSSDGDTWTVLGHHILPDDLNELNN